MAPLGQAGVIQGWNEGLVGMKKGGRRLLIIPPELGYGASGQGPIGPNETLVFVVDAAQVGWPHGPSTTQHRERRAAASVPDARAVAGHAPATAGPGRPPVGHRGGHDRDHQHGRARVRATDARPQPTQSTSTPVSPTPAAPAPDTNSTVTAGPARDRARRVRGDGVDRWHFVRRWRTTSEDADAAGPAGGPPGRSAADLVGLLTEFGAAFNAAGEPVGEISRRLRATAAAYGAPDAELVHPGPTRSWSSSPARSRAWWVWPRGRPSRCGSTRSPTSSGSRAGSPVPRCRSGGAPRTPADLVDAAPPPAGHRGAGTWRVERGELVLILAPSAISMLAGFLLGSGVGTLRLWRPAQSKARRR